ncbi:MAG: Ig-like domain-containing protein [Actinomycetes bacterium]|jgi:hypothetical protein|nr:Ig-like domain-containing protein [Actinomycetes bacterium]
MQETMQEPSGKIDLSTARPEQRELARLHSIRLALLCAVLGALFLFSCVSSAAALDKDNLPDGTYRVPISFLNMTRADKSMADASLLSHTATLTVTGGQYFVDFELGPITAFGETNYLTDLLYYKQGYTYVLGSPSGDTSPTIVLSEWLNQDGTPILDYFNDPAGPYNNPSSPYFTIVSTLLNRPYPRRLRTPIVPQALADMEGVYGMVPMEMTIPVMMASQFGGRSQTVYLAIDWTGYLSAEYLADLAGNNKQPSTSDDSKQNLKTDDPPQDLKPVATSVKTALSTVYIKKGAKLTLPYAVYGNITPTKFNLSWKTSKKAVATVTKGKANGSTSIALNANQKLTIRALKKGTATLTLTTPNKKTAKIKVVVVTKAKKLKKISIGNTPSGKKLTYGTTRTLTVKTTSKATLSGTAPKWSSSNTSVISVNAVGRLTAHKAGTATITVKVGTKKATVKLTVIN